MIRETPSQLTRYVPSVESKISQDIKHLLPTSLSKASTPCGGNSQAPEKTMGRFASRPQNCYRGQRPVSLRFHEATTTCHLDQRYVSHTATLAGAGSLHRRYAQLPATGSQVLSVGLRRSGH